MVRVRSCTRSLSAGLLVSTAIAGCLPDLDYLNQDNDGEAVAGSATHVGGSTHAGGTEMLSGGAGTSDSAGAPSADSAGAADGGNGGATNGGGASASAGSAGATNGGSQAACVASGEERCDGVDNDCNDVVDDGCPKDISTIFQSDLTLLGDSPGGSPFSDDCGAGEVLVGAQVAMGAFLTQVQGLCGKLSVALNQDATGYEMVIASGALLTAHPETSADQPVVMTCPNGEALVGVGVAQQYAASATQTYVIIPEIWLSCAQLSLAQSGSDYYVDWDDSHDLESVYGSMAGDTDWYQYSEVPVGQLATRLRGASGVWIDRLGLGVSNSLVGVVR